MAKRILWLLNHKTLMKAEVPVLQELGYEVFVPKFFPDDDANLSAEITYQFDETLTISKKELEILNKHNFYSGKINGRVKKIIENSFNTAFCGFFPEMINSLAEAFTHTIYLRVFGLAKNETYGRLIKEHCSSIVYNRILHNNNMYLAPSYPNIIFNEPHWLAKTAQFFPLGLPEDIQENANTWTGSREQILFVCPRIKTNPYYGKIYRDFKNQFGDLPYVIIGKQVRSVSSDPSVRGFVDQDTLYDFYRSFRVMFYHSQEIRHLHYHPLEAMLFGMPVIYMAGGLLDQTAGKKLPGCCGSATEAYDKLTRILDGDQIFIDEVISSQKVILKSFSTDEILDHWKKNFRPEYLYSEKENLQSSEENEINLGIWVHNTYPQSMTGEGINQVLGKTIGALTRLPNIRVKIACLTWIKKDLLEFLNSFGVDETKLDFILVSEKTPFIYRIYQWYTTRKPKPPRKKKLRKHFAKIYENIKNFVKSIVDRIISLRTIRDILIILLLSPILVIVGLPLALLGLLVHFALLPFIRLVANLFTRLKQFLNQSALSIIQRFARFSFNRIVENETQELITKTQTLDDLDVWLISYPNMPYINKFKQPTVLVVPDIIYNEFPTPYARELPTIVSLETNINNTIRNASHVVTYSEHVKEHHLIREGLRNSDTISVVQHAPMSSKDILDSNQRIALIKIISAKVIKDYLEECYAKTATRELLYQKELPWGSFDYIFVSSQTRPHKNHLNLVKAYRILLREKYKNVKLVFTGTFSNEMKDYISLNGLQYDVLSIPRIPAYEHAAFFAGAKLAIAPTLFEGGFPFLFSQAVSVGTPILMSDIPVVREILGENDISTFNPYAIQAIVEKLVWVWDNYATLLTHQQVIYEQMTHRSWDDVANDFRKIFTILVNGK